MKLKRILKINKNKESNPKIKQELNKNKKTFIK